MTARRIRVVDAAPAVGRRYAILAALAACWDGPVEAVLPLPDASDDVHARQHVTPEGLREENGVLWLERAGVRWRRGDGAIAELLPADEAAETLTLTAHWSETGAALRDAEGGAVVAARWDAYGRPWLEAGPAWPEDLARPAPPTPVDGPVRRVTIIGDPRRLRDVYCAAIAALGDAADAEGLVLEISVEPSPDAALDAEPDGVVLPGGADMSQVAPLTAAAARAFAQDLPTLGLCLGMQAMALAMTRTQPGLEAVALGEIEPDAPDLLFAPLTDGAGRAIARLGDRAVAASGARLPALLTGLETAWRERMNHCYRFELRFRDALAAAGVEIAGFDGREGVVDMIAGRGRRFFVGAQGHPELGSRPGAPHPLIRAFLRTLRGA